MVITSQGYTKYYYMGTDRVAAQIGKVSHMQAQHTQSDTIAGLISKSNTFMQCYGEIRSGGVMTSATNIPARSVMKRRVMIISERDIMLRIRLCGCRLIR